MSRLKGIIFAVIGLTVMAASIWNGLFRHAYFENYTTTITGAAGPTALPVGAGRQALPQPTPTNANSIFVAAWGNNGNAGTLLSPKQTLAGAYAATTGILNTIVILANGGSQTNVADIVMGASVSLASGRNIQAADGVVACIEGTTTQSIDCAGSNGLSGFFLTNFTTNQVTISGTAVTFSNVALFDRLTAQWGGISDATGVAQVTMNYSVFGIYELFNAGGTSTVTVNNCAALARNDKDDIFNLTGVGATVTNVVCTRCDLFATDSFASGSLTVTKAIVGCLSGATTQTFNFDATSCYLSAPGNIFYVPAAGTSTITSDLSFCLLAGTNSYSAVASTGTVSFSGTNTNTVNPSTPPLFADLMSFLDMPYSLPGGTTVPNSNTFEEFIDIIYGISFQAVGKSTINDGGLYLANSPLLTAGSSNVSLSAWTEATVLSSTGYAKETTIVYPAASYKRIEKPTNPVNIYDVNGNLHTNYDTIRNGFEFTFSGSSKFSLADDLRNLLTVLRDNGSVQVLPKSADNNNLFINEVSNITTGTFDAATNKFYMITSATDIELIDNNWRGFWVTLVIASVPTDFYIESNDFESFTLVDKLGNGFPASGDYTFSVDYILMTAEKQDLEAAAEYVTNFERGQGWRESGTDPYTKAQEFSPGGYTIRLWEIEDPTTGG